MWAAGHSDPSPRPSLPGPARLPLAEVPPLLPGMGWWTDKLKIELKIFLIKILKFQFPFRKIVYHNKEIICDKTGINPCYGLLG